MPAIPINVQASSTAVRSTIFTCPDDSRVVFGRIAIFNRTGSVSTETLSLAPEGAAHSDAQVIDAPLVEPRTTRNIGMVILEPGDVLRALSGAGSATYTLFGIRFSDFPEGSV